MTFELSMVETIGFAAVVLVFGRFLKQKIHFFQRFAIPSPVIGGFVFALINLVFRLTGILDIQFDTSMQEFFMVIFFTSVGYGASLKVLRSAGPKVLIFLGVATVLVILQSATAFFLAPVVNIEPALALMTGSVAMTGGHGVSGGIAPLVEAQGITGAQTVAYTAATFGLVAGSLMGGPLANRIITKRGLKPADTEKLDIDESILQTSVRELRADRVLQAFIVILFAMLIGSYITEGLNFLVGRFTDMAAFPTYLGSMLVAVVMRYISDTLTVEKYKELVPTQEVEIVGNVGLAIFLSVALMNIKLWELADLAVPLLVLLSAQIVLMYLFAHFVTFRVMGRNYDAAVLAAGHCGFGMGATPNGVANMDSVTQKFGPSRLAFFVLPIVGGMFIDFANILVILGFLAAV